MPSWQDISFSENLTLSFAMPYTGGTALCDLNDCLPSKADLLVSVPFANSSELGSSFTLNNVSEFSFKVVDINGSEIISILPGSAVFFYLIDNTTALGAWRTVLLSGTGANAIIQMSLKSSEGGLDIKGGEVTPPGGTVDLNIPLSLTNLSKLLSSGLVYANYNETDKTLSFLPVALTAGNNLVIEQDKDLKNYLLSLSDILTTLSYLETSGLHLEGNGLSALLDNIVLSTKDSKGKILLNPISIDGDGNIEGIKNLTLSGTLSIPSFTVGDITIKDDALTLAQDKSLTLQTSGIGVINLNKVSVDALGNFKNILSLNGIGLDNLRNLTNVSSLSSLKGTPLSLNGIAIDSLSNLSNVTSLEAIGDIKTKGKMIAEQGFVSPFLPKAWCCFVDTGQSENNIILEDSAGVASVTGKSGNYVINFETPFLNANYGFSCSVQKSSGSNFINSVFVQSRSASSCIVYTVDKQGNLISSIDALSIQIYSSS